MDDGHGLGARVLGLQLTFLADVHLLTDQTHIACSSEWVAHADAAGHVGMLDLGLTSQLFLLHGDRDLLLDLRLDHLNEELFVLGVHTTGALAATAWVRATLLGLSAIAAEAGDRLRVQVLSHELLVFVVKLLDLGLKLLDFRNLSGHHTSQTLQNSLHLLVFCGQLLLLGCHNSQVGLDSHGAVVLH